MFFRPLGLLLLFLFAPISAPAAGTDSLVDAFVVPCDSPPGAASGFDLPSGTYAVFIVGDCLYRGADTVRDLVIATPCEVPPVYNVPCVNAAQPVPTAVCAHAVPGFQTDCSHVVPRPVSCLYFVDEQCVDHDGAMIVHDTGGLPAPVTARFSDPDASDNAGTFLVVVAWTPDVSG